MAYLHSIKTPQHGNKEQVKWTIWVHFYGNMHGRVDGFGWVPIETEENTVVCANVHL